MDEYVPGYVDEPFRLDEVELHWDSGVQLVVETLGQHLVEGPNGGREDPLVRGRERLPWNAAKD